MPQSLRQDFGSLGAELELDASLSQPTAKLMVESISRMKSGSLAPSSTSGPLAHLFPAPASDHSGPFRMVCEIASGGMATVHLAVNRGLAGFEKFVAVKRIHPHLAQDKEFYEMFIDEARIAAKVNHPYVCSVFDFGHAESSYYIAMEFLHGEPLSKVLACAGEKNLHQPCFPHVAARIIANLAEGLHAAHSVCDESGRNLDIIHRDVNPQNLFVLYDGTVRVTDFGIARARHRLHETVGGRLKGTLAYMAPEQLRRADIDQGVDIWGLGVVLWEMLTARQLFRRSSDGETVMDVLSRKIVAPSEFNPHVSRELDTIVLRALSRHRSERYATAADLSRALEQYLTHSGDAVLAMDVAEWLSGLFPTGHERGRELLELARVRVDALPRFSLDEAATPTPRMHDSRSSFPAPARDTLTSLPGLAIDEPHAESPSQLTTETLANHPALRRRLGDRIVAMALTGSMALVALGVLGSLFRNLPSSSSHRAAPVAALNSLMPSALAPSHKQPRAEPLRFSASPSPEAPLAPARPPSPRRLSAARPQLPPSKPAVASFPGLQPGSLLVSTPGVHANVFEAGRALGRTPRQLDLSPGPHTLLVQSESGTRAVTVNVASGSAAVLSLALGSLNDQIFSNQR